MRFNKRIRRLLQQFGTIREDIGLLMMMKEVNRNEKVPAEKVMKALNS